MNNESQDNEVALSGLDGSNPLGFLAALGALRLFAAAQYPTVIRLRWIASPSMPVLSSRAPINIDLITDVCVTVSRHVFSNLLSKESYPSTTIDLTSGSFNAVAARVLPQSESASNNYQGLNEAVIAAMAVSAETLDAPINRTLFSFANGQSGLHLFGGSKATKKGKPQTFGGLRTIVADELLREWIQNCITVCDPISGPPSFSWCPTEYRPGASRLRDVEVAGFPGANVLAFFGLTFFPVIPSRRGPLTTGILDIRHERHFVWPLWSYALTADAIFSLVSQPMNGNSYLRGISDVRASHRIQEGKPPMVRYYFAPSSSI